MAAFEFPVLSLDNKNVGTVELLPEVFKLENINTHLIWEAVKHFLAKQRQGTAKTKCRWEVSGSGKKLWRQKGTGRARIGSIRSPLWRHGGTTQGPKPRDHEYAFPKKARRAAMRNALSSKMAEGKLMVVEHWDVSSHKTKSLIGLLSNLGVSSTALLVGSEASENLQRAAANNPAVRTIESLGLNIHDLLKFDQVIFSKSAILALQDMVKS